MVAQAMYCPCKMWIMANKLRPDAPGGMAILPLVLLNAIIIKSSFIGSEQWLWLLMITIPLLLLLLIKNGKKHPVTLRRTPLVRRPRFSFEPDQDEQLVRRHEQTTYVRFKVFSKGR